MKLLDGGGLQRLISKFKNLQEIQFLRRLPPVLFQAAQCVPDPIFTQDNAITLDMLSGGASGSELSLVPVSDDNPYKKFTTHELCIKKPVPWKEPVLRRLHLATGVLFGRANTVVVWRWVVKVPTNCILYHTGNSAGTGGRAYRGYLGIENIHERDLRGEVGTGYFKEYLTYCIFGTSGSVASNNGFIGIETLDGSEEDFPDEIRVACVQAFDFTALPGGAGDLATPYRAGLISPEEKQWLIEQMGK